MKTNAARLLEQLGVPYETRQYAVDPSDLSAESVAAKVGMPAERVYKTLLARGPLHGPCFAVVAGDAEIDLKALARLAGERSVELVPLKEVQPLTGYVRGGVTALAARKAFPVFLDEAALAHEQIAVSAGMRGAQLLLRPSDYVAATRAKTGPISRPKPR